jgi:hypothetical protein
MVSYIERDWFGSVSSVILAALEQRDRNGALRISKFIARLELLELQYDKDTSCER